MVSDRLEDVRYPMRIIDDAQTPKWSYIL